MSLVSAQTPVVALLGGARDTAIADSGAFYVGVTPTPGTGVISSASVQAFTETTPYLVLYNGGNLVIYPAHMRLHTTVVGATNSAAQNWTNTIDIGNRLTSGGTALTLSNTNMNSANKSGAIITVGAITATAATSSRRIVGHQAVKFVNIETVHDCLQFNWGGSQQVDPASLINNTSTLSHTTVNFAPIAIGPGQSMVLVRWGASYTTGVTYEVEFGYIEK